MLAHLLSSLWGFKGSIEIPEGSGFQMPDGTTVQVARVGPIFSTSGGEMPLGYIGTAGVTTDRAGMG